MRILLVGGILSNVLLIELAEQLVKDGHRVRLVDFISSLEYDFTEQRTKEVTSSLLFKFLLKIRFIRYPIKRFLARKVILDQPKGTIINAHYLSPYYIPFAKLAKQRDLKWISTIWGSDYLRASDNTKIELKKLFKLSDRITMVAGLAPEFKRQNSNVKKKVSITHFGLTRLTARVDKTLMIELKNEFGIPDHSTIICIGNNGSKAQQHLEVIQQIKRNEAINTESTHLVFPMTYGLQKEYLEEITKACDGLIATYSIIKRRLDDDELVSLQSLMDVIIFAQTSDAFSAFLCETIYFGAIPIVGKWLPYKQFEDWGVKVFKTSVDDLDSVFISLKENDLSAIKQLNSRIIENNLKWDATIHTWTNAYQG